MKVRMMSGMMVNTYLVNDEETGKGFIVDPGDFDPSGASKIAEEGIDIEYIILTHGHCDHIGGVERYRDEYPDVKVVAAKAEIPMLADAGLNMSTIMFGRPITVAPDMTVEEGDTLSCGNMNMKFVMTPGHSPGGMCVIMEGEDVVFSGDTLFQQSIGRTDFVGGSFDTLINSIKEKLFVLPDETIVYPGHMGPTKIGFEKEYNPFV